VKLQELRADGLVVTLGGITVLDGISLVAPAGRWVTITGPSGSGKSILLQVLAGLIEPAQGQVLVDGHPAGHGDGPVPGIVLQDEALLPILTVAETVALPLQAAGGGRAEIGRRTGVALDALGLSPAAGQLVSGLSGGQRQRVALARALALDAPLLLLDEPTAELDATNRNVVLDLVGKEVDRGAVVVVVSHDPVVLDRSDIVLTLASDHTLASPAPDGGAGS
jgi:putative ABC transport system ATP-binding protein